MKHDILESLVQTILLDLTEAQHYSNERSAQLAAKYIDNSIVDGHPEPLQFFPVPNSSIKAFDFSLSFALEDLNDNLNEDLEKATNSVINSAWPEFVKALIYKQLISTPTKQVVLRPQQ